jgi:phosphoglycolate phosphatase
VPESERARHVIGLGLADALAHAVPTLPPERVVEFSARYRHHYLAQEEAIELFAGARELLQALRAIGLQTAVATGKTRAGLARALAATGLQDLFDSTRCADETQSKPHPAMLLELLDELRVVPERAVMIGDTTHDLQMAAAARTFAIGVTYGAHPRLQLASMQPLALVDSIDDLRQWLTTHG